MTTGKTTNLKKLLRDECLPILAKASPYFSLDDVRAWLRDRRVGCSPALLRGYLSGFMRTGVIHNAGRGWYSRLAQPFVMDRMPVASLVEQLTQAFPLLDYSCWSTEQIRSYGHLLLARYVSFVHTDRDAMPSVFDFLKNRGYDVYLNPRGPSARNFTIREQTVVVRPRVTTQPAEVHFATIEALLVDLFVECRVLSVLDQGEYFRTYHNLVGQARISMGSLLTYAIKRKPATNRFLNQLTEGFQKTIN